MNDLELLDLEDILDIHKEALSIFGEALSIIMIPRIRSEVFWTNKILISVMINILLFLIKPPCSGTS